MNARSSSWTRSPLTRIGRKPRAIILGAIAAAVAISFVPTNSASPAAAAGEPGAMSLVTTTTGARNYWAAGFTGKGVDIAIIDSGVAPVEGLATPGKLIYGPDLSFEAADPAKANIDTYGHGTHLAGIIAGRDSSATGSYANDTTSFLGMAPDARLVSLKVADSQGRTDVSQVIAAIDWVVQHKNDGGLNIRVLNIAFGTDSRAGWQHDALVYAAEQAWKAGIFVVVSAGNDGPNSKSVGSLSNLAQSPNLMSMGATDMLGNGDPTDDKVPSFSSTGTLGRWVEAVAPGSHIVSLKAPNSSIATNYAAGGAVGNRFFRGSGTSQAAAVMSGAAALLIQQRPDITPQQIRQLVWKTATILKKEPSETQGAGELNLAKMLKMQTPPGQYWGYTGWSDGLGTLGSARGSKVLLRNGKPLDAESDVLGAKFDNAAVTKLQAKASSWSGSNWNGNQWAASSWSASSWSASSWSASSWSASSWSASTWSASSWSASSWSSSSWN